MPVNIEKFIKHLRDAADDGPPGHGKCGEYVRKALQAGGAHFNEYSPPHYGKLYCLTLDFVQRDFWAGKKYRSERPQYAVYRY